MALKTVTEAGFYAGRFLKPGQAYEDESAGIGDLDKLTKDELIALASEQGVEVKSSATKAEIILAIEANASN